MTITGEPAGTEVEATSPRSISSSAAQGDRGSRRKDIQGLRAIAVLSVVLFHSGLGVPGGFVGVDVFFVISGYVITAMLLRERESAGRIGLGRFYLRRFRRLTPALAAMVAVTMVASYFILPKLAPQENAGATGMGAMLLAANFVIGVTTGNYFDAPADGNPLLHTWSLAVEEQFYLVFPSLLAIAWLLARRSRRSNSRALLLVGFIAAASFALALVGSASRDAAASWLDGFYSPFARAWEFAVGALLVLGAGTLSIASRWRNSAVGWVGLATLLSSFWLINGDTQFTSAWNLLPVGATALLLFAGQGSDTVVTRVLAWRPMVALGDWSYSIYLWHWPMIVFAVTLWPFSGHAAPIAAGASFVPALMSYYLLESPIREIRALSRPKMALLVAVTVLPALLIAASLYLNGRKERTDDQTKTAAHSSADVGEGFASPIVEDIGHREIFTYTAEHFAPCTPESLRKSADRWEGTIRCQQSKAGEPPTVAPLGDSHMEHLFLGFAEAAPGENVVYYTQPGYPVRPRYAQILDFVQQDPKIHTVVVCARWGYKRDTGALEVDDLVEVLRALRAAGKAVFVLGDVPDYPFGAEACRLASSADDERCSQDTDAFQVRYHAYFDKLQAAVSQVPGVTLIETAPFFCTATSCSMRVDGYLMYRDSDHLGMTGSRYVARRILEENPDLLPDEPRLPRGSWFAPRPTESTGDTTARTSPSSGDAQGRDTLPGKGDQDPRLAIAHAHGAARGAQIVAAESGVADGRAFVAFTMRSADGTSKRVMQDFHTSEVLGVESTDTPLLATSSLPPKSAEQALNEAFSHVSHAQIREITLIERDGGLFRVIDLDAAEGRETFEISAVGG